MHKDTGRTNTSTFIILFYIWVTGWCVCFAFCLFSKFAALSMNYIFLMPSDFKSYCN